MPNPFGNKAVKAVENVRKRAEREYLSGLKSFVGGLINKIKGQRTPERMIEAAERLSSSAAFSEGVEKVSWQMVNNTWR
ncbi:MAG: hypothetical protein IKP10_06895 [Clostridia bacterium]|nr:hypothetical protein [Clostridia bacterium]